MELWDIYDSRMEKTGRVHERGVPVPAGDYHLTVHIWPYDDSGRLFVQKRTETVQVNPGKWAPTSGSVIAGETMLCGMRRELSEELGIDADKFRTSLLAVLKKERSFLGIYIVGIGSADDLKISLQESEVETVKWVTRDELAEMMKNDKIFFRPDYTDILFGGIDRETEKETDKNA